MVHLPEDTQKCAICQTFVSYYGNIDPAFPRNSLCDQISSHLNLQKNYFLITQASMVKIFVTAIHRESHPISTCIPVMYLTTQYLSCEILHKCIANETT